MAVRGLGPTFPGSVVDVVRAVEQAASSQSRPYGDTRPSDADLRPDRLADCGVAAVACAMALAQAVQLGGTTVPLPPAAASSSTEVAGLQRQQHHWVRMSWIISHALPSSSSEWALVLSVWLSSCSTSNRSRGVCSAWNASVLGLSRPAVSKNLAFRLTEYLLALGVLSSGLPSAYTVQAAAASVAPRVSTTAASAQAAQLVSAERALDPLAPVLEPPLGTVDTLVRPGSLGAAGAAASLGLHVAVAPRLQGFSSAAALQQVEAWPSAHTVQAPAASVAPRFSITAASVQADQLLSRGRGLDPLAPVFEPPSGVVDTLVRPGSLATTVAKVPRRNGCLCTVVGWLPLENKYQVRLANGRGLKLPACYLQASASLVQATSRDVPLHCARSESSVGSSAISVVDSDSEDERSSAVIASRVGTEARASARHVVSRIPAPLCSSASSASASIVEPPSSPLATCFGHWQPFAAGAGDVRRRSPNLPSSAASCGYRCCEVRAGGDSTSS